MVPTQSCDLPEMQMGKIIESCTNGLLTFGVSWNVLSSEANEAAGIPQADSHLVYALTTDTNDVPTAKTEVFSPNVATREGW